MTRNRSAPPSQAALVSANLGSLRSHGKLCDNVVSLCEKGEQSRQTGEGGAGGKKKESAGTTEELQTTGETWLA